MIQTLVKASIAIAFMVPLSGCAAVRVADTAVDTAVFAGRTTVRGVAAGGRLVTGAGREECENGERRRTCNR